MRRNRPAACGNDSGKLPESLIMLAYKRLVRLPKIPLTSALPSDELTERTTDFIAASVTVWRPEPRGAAVLGAG